MVIVGGVVSTVNVIEVWLRLFALSFAYAIIVLTPSEKTCVTMPV